MFSIRISVQNGWNKQHHLTIQIQDLTTNFRPAKHENQWSCDEDQDENEKHQQQKRQDVAGVGRFRGRLKIGIIHLGYEVKEGEFHEKETKVDDSQKKDAFLFRC